MKDFLDGLDDRLAAMAVDMAAETPPVPDKKRRRFKRPAILGAITATLAGAGTIFALGGTSLAELPILQTATTDVSAKKAALQAASERGVDFTKAHSFGTPNGPGFVLVSTDRNAICVSIPDSGRAAGDYGSSCSGPVSEVERTGLGAELTGDRGQDPNATSLFAFVLPDHASQVRLESGGKSSKAHAEAGVVVASIAAPTSVTWIARGKRGREDFSGPFTAATNVRLTCHDGRSVLVPLPPHVTSLTALTKQACS